MNNHNDLTFFTNEEGRTLLDRFNKILSSNTQFFDVLVGYFRTSGFYKMYSSLQGIEKIRILVGINVDKKTVEIINQAEEERMNFMSNKKTRQTYSEEVKDEMESSEDSIEVEDGIKKFIEYINTGKLEIRVYPIAPIHAKVYIMRKNESSDYYGSVITGSSNFSKAGFLDNLEFNVELRDSRDVDFALEKFEELWAQSVDVTDEYIDTINKDTWLREDITPYELYLKFLYEYFKEEINQDKADFTGEIVPDNFMKIQYQIDAVNNAKRILDAYNGVFISDVVGLGKTYICAMLAKILRGGKKLVICPPVLMDNWRNVLLDFDVAARIESLGKLDSLNSRGVEDYRYVFIDEAHRFRNASTESFSMLHEICLGKKVILVSATPQNNYTTDIANQIFLFQQKNNSTIIPNEKNLEGFFNKLNKGLKEAKDDKKQYLKVLRHNSEIIRDKVLRSIMIRRTRKEIMEYYGGDLKKQGLTFPTLNTPEQIIYEFDSKTDKLFMETISLIGALTYARYKPLTYLTNIPKSLNALIVGQKNMGGFMKSILLKRLESSFFAFKQTLSRFVESYDNFIKMYEGGVVYISKKVDVYDLLDNGDDEKLMKLVEEEKVQKFDATMFNEQFIKDLRADRDMMGTLLNKWGKITIDPKFDHFEDELKKNPIFWDNKIIIFTESKETAEYLKLKLDGIYSGKIIAFTGQSSERLRREIEANFNPNYRDGQQKNDYRILVTTDVLAEGINLHRSNVIVNYDLPWNPTKVMQRVGRINRVGTKFNEIHVFNFFPTSQTNKYLSLKDNITSKIQAFHDTLGEDFKYLTEEEEVSSFGLSGGKEYASNYYDMINSKDILEGDDEQSQVSELKYLRIIRDIRDKDIELFEKIKKLPKKARSARKFRVKENSTVTFFRKGALNKFFISTKDETRELTFLEAVKFMESTPETERNHLKNEFYNHLKNSKEHFNAAVSEGEVKMNEMSKKSGNDSKVITILKALRRCKQFTDGDEDKIEKLKELWDKGTIPAAITKEVIKEVKGVTEPIKIMNIILDIVPENYLNYEEQKKVIHDGKSEIILSSYLVKED